MIKLKISGYWKQKVAFFGHSRVQRKEGSQKIFHEKPSRFEKLLIETSMEYNNLLP